MKLIKEEKELIKSSLWDLVKGCLFCSPTKAIDGFEKIFMFVRRRKVYWLIQSMGLDSQNLSEEDKQKFSNYFETDYGQQRLEEFVDATLKTSSKTAIVALGILFADIEHGNYDEEFKHLSCKALQGISEDLIDYFLPICELESVGDNGMTWIEDTTTTKVTKPIGPAIPYKVVMLSDTIIDKNSALKNVIRSPEDAFASIHELIRRGMFLPDYASSRTGFSKGWGVFFGVTRTSLQMKELLLKAKILSGQLKNEPVMESQIDD